MLRIALLFLTALPLSAAPKPNVVLILADDLGYGDVSCLNPAGKIQTPNIDRLAKGGMTFTDAHTASAVCSPTRYDLLTGRYNWRSTLQQGVLGGYSQRLIEPNRTTIAAFMKSQGYRTACVGKWHLGMNFPLKDGGTASGYAQEWKVDYAKPFTQGPTSVGFDSYFGISASLDMPPYAYLRNDRVETVPTVEKTWIRKGPASTDFEAVDVLPKLFAESVKVMESAKEPFFLYLPLTGPHTPIVPTPEYTGKSKLTPYADFTLQVDGGVGTILDALDRLKLAENTIVIFTSDNGFSPAADLASHLAKGHDPSAGFRGHKADIFDGGHHVPYIVRYPARVKPGSMATKAIRLGDTFRTLADVLGEKLPDDVAEDSVSFLPLLDGKPDSFERPAIVHHSINGSFAVRAGTWKLCLCAGSGGWSAPRPGKDDVSKLPAVQLFDLAADPGEKVNVEAKHPEKVAELTALLEKFVAEGRSTPGKPSKNTVEPNIRKPHPSPKKK